LLARQDRSLRSLGLNSGIAGRSGQRGHFVFKGNFNSGGATPTPSTTLAAFLLGTPNVVTKSGALN
jgi:hypothetical protein